jgi:hypothetical protein
MLEGARKAIRNTFSTDDPDDPGNEDT